MDQTARPTVRSGPARVTRPKGGNCKGWVGVGQPGRNKLQQEDDGGADNEAEEDSSERYESDYGNEGDSLY